METKTTRRSKKTEGVVKTSKKKDAKLPMPEGTCSEKACDPVDWKLRAENLAKQLTDLENQFDSVCSAYEKEYKQRVSYEKYHQLAIDTIKFFNQPWYKRIGKKYPKSIGK